MNVILKSKVGSITLSTNFGEKAVKFDFQKETDFTCSVPTRVEVTDTFGKVHLVHQNYAQNLLNSYKDSEGNSIFEIVEVKPIPAVEVPKKKGKKDE